MGYYIKAKQFIVKPELKKQICDTVRENFERKIAARIVRYITNDKPLTFSRWLKYFEYEVLDDILIEVEDEENIKDLGI